VDSKVWKFMGRLVLPRAYRYFWCFLHCDVSYAMWSAIFSCFGLSWVMPLKVLDLFACWWTAGRPRSAVIWKMVPTYILWCVWKEINDRCFEDLERSLEDILSFFFFFILCIFGR
jgi:hypothetical protein